MNLQKPALIICLAFLLSPLSLLAGDWAWMEDFDITAHADPSGFRASLATRFGIGDAQIGMVLSNVGRPADVYMVFRLGEMSSRTSDYIVREYKTGKGRGWGQLAKSVGIKPGSREFHALKTGQNLWRDGPGKVRNIEGHDKDKGKGKGPGKGKGKG
jgi:hypothetical protein